MRSEDFQVGVRIIGIYPSRWPDILGQVGTIREVRGDQVWITWNDPLVRESARGRIGWMINDGDPPAWEIFDFADSEQAQKSLEQQADQQRRHEHAMKWL